MASSGNGSARPSAVAPAPLFGSSPRVSHQELGMHPPELPLNPAASPHGRRAPLAARADFRRVTLGPAATKGEFR
jgi:hypothetical protein